MKKDELWFAYINLFRTVLSLLLSGLDTSNCEYIYREIIIILFHLYINDAYSNDVSLFLQLFKRFSVSDGFMELRMLHSKYNKIKKNNIRIFI